MQIAKLEWFPKRTKKDQRKSKCKRKQKENKENQKETKKKQTPQGGGRWPRPPCLSVLAWGREDIS